MWFGYNPQIIFSHFFSKLELSHFSGILTNVVCTLCAQLLLQFYSDSFETLHMFLPWFEDMHVVWI